MSSSTVVVIVRPEHLVSVRKRMVGADAVSVISEAEVLLVQDTILARAPDLLVMHAAFAVTSRGASVIGEVKAKPHKTGTAIRVFIEDEVRAPMMLSEASVAAVEALLETSRPLDRAGTRQAARYPMQRRAVQVNGDDGQLLDLSVSGAQVETAMRLRPLKVARIILSDDTSEISLQGTVAWAIAVPSGGAILYRAGVEFVNPEKTPLEVFCSTHGGPPDLTMSNEEPR